MAILGTENRSREITEASLRFEMDHLVDPESRQVAMAHARLAQEMLLRIREDDPKLMLALHQLADARDSFIDAIVHFKRGATIASSIKMEG